MELDRFDYFRRPRWLASYETDEGAAVVRCVLVSTGRGLVLSPLVLPFGYLPVCRRHKSGSVALVPGEDALAWRPCLHELQLASTMQLGSQMELGYRYTLREVDDEKSELRAAAKAGDPERLARAEEARGQPLPSILAREKARRLLAEQLSPQQLLEFRAWRSFHVRGTINQLYRIRPGNGLEIVDPRTLYGRVLLCLHTEDWIPDADNALAAKLLIESGQDGEEQLLAAAKPYPHAAAPGPRPLDLKAWALHRELLPGPQQVLAA